MQIRRNAKVVVSLMASAVAYAPAWGAQTVAYGIDAGVGQSDNVTLVPDNKVSQTLAVLDADFAVKEQSRLFDVSAKGNFTYLDFLQHAYSNELVGRFDGIARAALIPEKLTWVLQDDFGQAQVDPFAAVTPNNRENINYLSTGPDAALRLGRVAFVDVTARYARTQYAVSPFNNNRFLGTVAVGTPLSARSSLSLGLSTEKVLFENTVQNTNFDRSSLFGHYAIKGSRTDVTSDLGYTRVTVPGGSTTGPLARLQLSRQLSSATKLILAVGREITDGSTTFSNSQTGVIASGDASGAATTSGAGVTSGTGVISGTGAASGIGVTSSAGVTSPSVQTSANYKVTYASLGWEYNRDRTSFGLSGRWDKNAYDNQPQLDLTRDTAEVRLGRTLSTDLRAQLQASIYKVDYANVAFSETDKSVGLEMTYQAGRALELSFRYDHVARSVSGTGFGYAENRAFISVGYRPRVVGSPVSTAGPQSPGS